MTKDNVNWPETESLDSLTDSETEANLESTLASTVEKIDALGADADPVERGKLLLTKMITLLGLNRKTDIWNDARPLLELFIENHLLEEAVQTCDVLYQSEQAESIAALVHGVWLSVSFPMDPHLTVMMLNHIVDETPKDSDGAALAAMTAHYIVGTRASEKEFENLNFFTSNLLTQVAGGHAMIETQDDLNAWIDKKQLNDPAIFLPRLGAVLNVIVNERDWWFDRDELRARFPQ